MFESSLQGAIQVIRSTSPLNADSVEEFENTFEGILGNGQPLTVFDMSSVPLVDSRGLESMLDMQEKFCRRGGDLKLSGLNPLCKDIMHVTQIEQHFSIYDKVIDAVGSFAK